MEKPRVMWLLNHTSLRGFEIEMLKAVGINEIFTPKIFPYDESNLSADVTYEYDKTLTIPNDEISILNTQNWYKNPSSQAWEIANKYFDIIFIAFFPEQICSTIYNFKGQIILRAFGLVNGYSYTNLLQQHLNLFELGKVHEMRDRFWFGAGYEFLKYIEGNFLEQQECFLPVGLKKQVNTENWKGSDKKIFFVCPRINTSPYYNKIYQKFKKIFKEYSYVIGGAQPIKVLDDRVMGYVTRQEHDYNMRELRVMFYHSKEQFHIHYHPFEAISQGMPLIFMANGMLDQLGGNKLPGRCKTIKEAKKKIQRILNDDWKFIESIRKSQLVLLESMEFDNCLKYWQEGFDKILHNLKSSKDKMKVINSYIPNDKKKKIAVILPVAYKGGSLRGAKLFAEAIYLGSIQSGEESEIILAHLDLPEYSEEDFLDMHPAIKRRAYNWQLLNSYNVMAAFNYAGKQEVLDSPIYQIPDDGINYFLDCDLWVFISDRLEYPLFPIKPYVVMVYDYLQHYEQFLTEELNQAFIRAAHKAVKVVVTTEFTKQEALEFAGIAQSKVTKCPMLIPNFLYKIKENNTAEDYFLWTTNLAIHKNHFNAFKALYIYYNEFNGQLNCYMTGVDTDLIFKEELPHLKGLHKFLNGNPMFRDKFKNLGNLPEMMYQKTLGSSQFLWHPARMDNGTFSVIEAAFFGVPSLSSNYPAMKEIDQNFKLNMMIMDPWNPLDMAQKLKQMETHAQARRGLLPPQEALKNNTAKEQAATYWNVIRECL